MLRFGEENGGVPITKAVVDGAALGVDRRSRSRSLRAHRMATIDCSQLISSMTCSGGPAHPGGVPQVPVDLKVHPDLWGRAQQVGKAPRRVGGDTALL